MKRLFILIVFLTIVIPSFGQYKNGAIDRTGAEPVYRNDLNSETAEYVLNPSDYQRFSQGKKIIKAGAITTITGASVVCVTGITVLYNLCFELTILPFALLDAGNESTSAYIDSLDKTYNVCKICVIAGTGVALVGCGLMGTGAIIQRKVANKYYKEHPYSEFSLNASGTSLGIALKF